MISIKNNRGTLISLSKKEIKAFARIVWDTLYTDDDIEECPDFSYVEAYIIVHLLHQNYSSLENIIGQTVHDFKKKLNKKNV